MKEIASVEVTEIEVTPEMIEAGVEVLEWFDPAEASPEMRREIVSEIYEVMHRSKSAHQTASSESSNARLTTSSPFGSLIK